MFKFSAGSNRDWVCRNTKWLSFPAAQWEPTTLQTAHGHNIAKVISVSAHRLVTDSNLLWLTEINCVLPRLWFGMTTAARLYIISHGFFACSCSAPFSLVCWSNLWKRTLTEFINKLDGFQCRHWDFFFPCLIPKQRKAAVCTVIFVSSQDPYKGWRACLNHTTSTASCQCFYQQIHWGVDVDRLGADRELAPEIGCPTRHSVTLVLLKEAPCECSQTAASVASSSGSLWHFIYITQHNLSPPERWAHLAHSRGGLAGPVILNSLVR